MKFTIAGLNVQQVVEKVREVVDEYKKTVSGKDVNVSHIRMSGKEYSNVRKLDYHKLFRVINVLELQRLGYMCVIDGIIIKIDHNFNGDSEVVGV